MVEEEDKNHMLADMDSKDHQVDHLQKKMAYLQDALSTEEDAKRRMLLRYIHAVKEHAMSSGDGAGGVLQLPESNITDEEVHALAALLRNNTNIDELNLRGNNITDDGARALGAVLAGRSGLRVVDLRGNKIGKGAIRVLAEALERSERVRHVYVHAGGKIEALGAGKWAAPRAGADEEPVDPKVMVTVETICVVDVRENNPEAIETPYELQTVENSNFKTAADGAGPFNPLQMLESTGAPQRGAMGMGMGMSADPASKKKALGRTNGKLRSAADPAEQAMEAKKAKLRVRCLQHPTFSCPFFFLVDFFAARASLPRPDLI